MPDSLPHEFAGFFHQNHGNAVYHAAMRGTKNNTLIVLCDYKGDVSHMSVTPDVICPDCDKLLPEFVVQEHSSHFSVLEVRTGKSHILGDGVDALIDADPDGDSIRQALTPGTAGFREAWEKGLNSIASDTREAYFPEVKPKPKRKTPVTRLKS